MKAIQIRYLAATNTKPSRLRAWAEGCKAEVRALTYENDIEQDARDLASGYMMRQGWEGTIYGFGCLPNGDYVATLGE